TATDAASAKRQAGSKCSSVDGSASWEGCSERETPGRFEVLVCGRARRSCVGVRARFLPPGGSTFPWGPVLRDLPGALGYKNLRRDKRPAERGGHEPWTTAHFADRRRQRARPWAGPALRGRGPSPGAGGQGTGGPARDRGAARRGGRAGADPCPGRDLRGAG